MVTNLGIVGEISVFLWYRRLWWLLPLFVVMSLILLSLKSLVWLAGLPNELSISISHASQERLERKIKAEGRNIYPLW